MKGHRRKVGYFRELLASEIGMGKEGMAVMTGALKRGMTDGSVEKKWKGGGGGRVGSMEVDMRVPVGAGHRSATMTRGRWTMAADGPGTHRVETAKGAFRYGRSRASYHGPDLNKQ
jgi:hypothetical protein